MEAGNKAAAAVLYSERAATPERAASVAARAVRAAGGTVEQAATCAARVIGTCKRALHEGLDFEEARALEASEAAVVIQARQRGIMARRDAKRRREANNAAIARGLI